jgi:four helix bundle protein
MIVRNLMTVTALSFAPKINIMFDFEKLTVYQKAKEFNKEVYNYLVKSQTLDRVTKDQLRRASFSIMLNIAEGSGRVSKSDRRNFFIIARGSIFECVAIFDFLKEQKLIEDTQHCNFYQNSEELSKIIYAMIKNLG